MKKFFSFFSTLFLVSFITVFTIILVSLEKTCLAQEKDADDFIEEEEFPTPRDSGELISQEEADDDTLFLPSSSQTSNKKNLQFGTWDGRKYKILEPGKPGFSFHLGAVRKDYGISILTHPKIGIELGLMTRFMHIPNFPISFLVGGGVSIFNLGSVQASQERIVDILYRFGAFVEFSLNRKFQILFGALHYISRPTNSGTDAQSTSNTLSRIKETRFSPGIGVQYEFRIIPHGSMGLRLWIEERITSILLSFSISPTPRNERKLDED